MTISPKALQPNTLLADRFRIVSLVAMGGQSVVYRGVDTHSGSAVAVKMMRGTDDVDEVDARRQFQREFEVLAAGGPGLPAAVAMLEHDGQPVVVEEWIEGQTLEREGTRVPVERATRLMIKVLECLEHLHSRNPPVIVRDVKPSNLIVRGEDVWIIDLNSARALRGPRDTVALGTPGFAAPEQHSGMSEIRSDLFSVGAVLSFLLTGEDGTLTRLPCRPARIRGDVPSAIDAVVRKATQFDAERRYASAREMADALRQALAGRSVASQGAPARGRGKGRRPRGATPPSANPTAFLPSASPSSSSSSSATGPGVYTWSGGAGNTSAVQTMVPPSAVGVFLVATAVGATLRFCAWCAFSVGMGVLGFFFMCPWLLSRGFRAFIGQSWPSERGAWLAGMIWVWMVPFPSQAPPPPQQLPTPVTPAPVRTPVVPQGTAGPLVAGDAGRSDVALLPRPRSVSWGWARSAEVGPLVPAASGDHLVRIDPFVVTWSAAVPRLVAVHSNGTASQVEVRGTRVIDVVPAVLRNAAPSVVVATDRGLFLIEVATGQVTASTTLKGGQEARSLVPLWRTGSDGPAPSPPLAAALCENGMVTLYDRRLAIMAQATLPPQVRTDKTARLYGAGARLVAGGTHGFWVTSLPLKGWTRLDRLPPEARPVADSQGVGLYFVAPRHMAYLDGDGEFHLAAAVRDYEPRFIETPLAMAYRHCKTDANYGRQYLMADQGTINTYRADTSSGAYGSRGHENWSSQFFWFRGLQGEFLAMAVDRSPGAPVGVLSQEGGGLHWVAWNSFGQKVDEATLPVPGLTSRALDAVITDRGMAVLYPEGIVLLKPQP